LLAIIRGVFGRDLERRLARAFQRTLYFLHHFPRETPIYGDYLLPASADDERAVGDFSGGDGGPVRDFSSSLRVSQPADQNNLELSKARASFDRTHRLIAADSVRREVRVLKTS
jgi:hypothetical protein